MTIKFQCVNVQHAIIAALRMRGLGRKTLRIGRAVLSEGDWSYKAIEVATQNMSHTLTPTEYDLNILSERGEI